MSMLSEIKLICGDSMKIMDTLDRRFNMIFIDPPYFEWADKTPIPDHNKLSGLTLQNLEPNGIVWLFGTQPQLAEDWHYWARFFRINFELIAYKHAGTPPVNKRTPIKIHENVWCLSRKECSLDRLKLDVRTRVGRTVRVTKAAKRMATRYGKSWKEWKKEVGYIKSVVHVDRIDTQSKEYEGHPAQKPLNLTRLIVRASTNEGDWILDPFAGVGTTLVACKELNRNCLGIEINEAYVKLANRRLQRLEDVKRLEKWMK